MAPRLPRLSKNHSRELPALRNDLEQRLGSASVTLQFDLSRDINAAAVTFRRRSMRPAATCPPSADESEVPEFNPSDQPILILSMQSDVVPTPQMYDMASSVFAQRLSQIEGVGQVQVNGGSLPAVRVELNPQPVSKYSVGLDQTASFWPARMPTDRR